MNKTILIGRLTRDPELKKGSNGSEFVTFTLAVNRPFANNEGEKEADFIPCIAFGKTAELINKYVNKGSLLCVESRIQVRNYTAQDGSTRYATEIICNNVVFLEAKQKEEYSPYDMPNQNFKNNGEKLPF